MQLCGTLRTLIEEDLKILEIYHSLSDFFMLNYYTHNGHNILPESWFKCCKDLQPQFIEQLIQMLSSSFTADSSVKFIMPLSLLSFIALMRSRLSKRKVSEISSTIKKPFISKKEQLRYLKPKKIIELESLLPFVEKVIRKSIITHVVDIGSGLGHASRFIAAHFPECSVLRIEAQSQLIEKAESIDERFKSNDESSRIYSSVHRLCLSNNIYDSFKKILADVDSKNKTNFTQSNILLLGLHPCGNLGSFILKLYKNAKVCRGLIMISCCYLFIDVDDENKGGFPMSNFLEDKGVKELSLQLKEQACHNAEFYMSRLSKQMKGTTTLSQHWRSIADIFIADRDPDYLKSCYKFKMKKKNPEDIVQFINKNLIHHGFKCLSTDEGIKANALSYANHWKTWNYYFFYVIKLFLGVVGESLIVNDRLLFLLESNIDSKFDVIFCPEDSPRNIAITSNKPVL